MTWINRISSPNMGVNRFPTNSWAFTVVFPLNLRHSRPRLAVVRKTTRISSLKVALCQNNNNKKTWLSIAQITKGTFIWHLIGLHWLFFPPQPTWWGGRPAESHTGEHVYTCHQIRLAATAVWVDEPRQWEEWRRPRRLAAGMAGISRTLTYPPHTFYHQGAGGLWRDDLLSCVAAEEIYRWTRWTNLSGRQGLQQVCPTC